MDFIKRNYEKILLGVVLFGLTAAVVYMLIEIPSEKQALKEKTEKSFRFNNKPLDPPATAAMDAAFGRLERPTPLNFASGHNLFNPVQWQKKPDGHLLKIATGNEVGPSAMAVNKTAPLFTTITFEGPGASEGTYLVGIQRDAEIKPSNRGKKSKYAALNEKNEYFTLRGTNGTPDKQELTLELVDTGERIKVSADHPYQRVDGYTADLEYKPEGKKWTNRRIGDSLVLGTEVYTVAGINLVATNQYEVILSAKSTGKKTTIRYNSAM